jgi:NADH:ubiquinone oxidoreductase subunit H
MYINFPFLNFNKIFFIVFFLFFFILFALLPFPFTSFIYLSNSIFSMLGNVRFVFFLISYELVIYFIFVLIFSLYLYLFFYFSFYTFYIFLFFFIIFFISILADTARVPFDLIEGESELVSGFNTELSIVSFILIFFSEYIILFVFILVKFFLLNFYLFILIFIFINSRALLVRVFYIFVIFYF